MQSGPHAGIAQPAVTVIDITDPTAVNAGIELIDQEAVQLQSMPLRARRVILRLEPATVILQSTNRRLRTVTSLHPGLVAYVTFGPRADGIVNGVRIKPGVMLAAEPRTEAQFVVEPGWESLTLLVPPEDIRAHLVARHREPEFHVPRGIELLEVDPERARSLFDWGKRLATTAVRQPDIFNEGSKQQRAALVELFETLLSAAGTAHQIAPTRSKRAGQAHSKIVRIAETRALSEPGEHLSVSDLCRAAGVSERTLEYAFHNVMGLTPVAYLIRLRLHRVRQGLLAGSHATTTVTTEALNWGFWHFGEFSRAYKQCFGELPSDTLRRPPPRLP